MRSLKQILLELKSDLLELEMFREKSAIEKIMLRRNEPQKVENAILLIVNRKTNNKNRK